MQDTSRVYPAARVQEPLFAISSEADLSSDKRPRASEGVDRPTIEGKRVLIVEDEFLVAIQVEDALASFGAEPVGPITTLDAALRSFPVTEFELAVLDINLGGKMVYPLADELAARGIPFLFVSGYAPQDIPEQYRSIPRVQKPFDARSMKAQIESLLNRL